MSRFSKEFLTWLDTNADHIDQESGPIADHFLKKLLKTTSLRSASLLSLNGLRCGPTHVVDVLNEWHNTL